MWPNLNRLQVLVVAVMSLALLLQDHIKVSFDRNSNTTATSAFKFKTVSPPAKDDAATNAKMMLLDGDVDPNGGGLSALVEGFAPTMEDQPAANLFFTAGTLGTYRYLVFDCYATEVSDNWGNTFYSEVDVIAKK